LDKIRKFFNEDIKHTADPYCRWDFESDETIYELKSRNVYSNTYQDVMIGYNKVQPVHFPQVFLFNFIDGLYYIRYSDLVFSHFELKLFKREGRVDYNDKPQVVCHIPRSFLNLIS
jgi:hypothetical protein